MVYTRQWVCNAHSFRGLAMLLESFQGVCLSGLESKGMVMLTSHSVQANLAASSLDSISSSRRDPLLNSLSEALHELAITTNSRLAAYFVEPSNLSHWALQACEEQLCGVGPPTGVPHRPPAPHPP